MIANDTCDASGKEGPYVTEEALDWAFYCDFYTLLDSPFGEKFRQELSSIQRQIVRSK